MMMNNFTETVIANGARRVSSLRAKRGHPGSLASMDCHVAALLAMTVNWFRHCERSAAIQEVWKSGIAASLTLLAMTVNWFRHCERSAAIQEVWKSGIAASLTLLAMTVIIAPGQLP